MHTGILNFLQKLGGGKLYHCWFCRLQFYDTRQQFNTGRKPGSRLLTAAPPTVKPAADKKLAVAAEAQR
jgi:hypothetical protein